METKLRYTLSSPKLIGVANLICSGVCISTYVDGFQGIKTAHTYNVMSHVHSIVVEGIIVLVMQAK
jgi:hypothetical protein